MADYEALKDQWSDIEDRDGIRLSWNTFPSSRMVGPSSPAALRNADYVPGSFTSRRYDARQIEIGMSAHLYSTDRRPLYTTQGKA